MVFMAKLGVSDCTWEYLPSLASEIEKEIVSRSQYLNI